MCIHRYSKTEKVIHKSVTSLRAKSNSLRIKLHRLKRKKEENLIILWVSRNKIIFSFS